MPPDALRQSRKALMEKDEETSDSSPSLKSVDDSEACSKLKCKFDGGLPLGSVSVSGFSSSSADRPENHCLTRIFVDVVEEYGSGCFFCKDKTFCIGEANPMTVMICHQCEKEYHLGCLKRHGRNTEMWNPPWFCSSCCSNIHFALGSVVRNGPIVIHESQLGTLKRNEEEKQANKLEVQCQILGGQHQPSDLLQKVASIFEDTFDPIMKGDHNLLNSMVHGKSEAGEYFHGMYCAVLIIESVIISAGIFRIFGTAVAELPLVATLRGSQNKGYFRVLFGFLEKFLSTLGVKVLMVPVKKEQLEMWKKLGFKPMLKDLWLGYASEHPILAFANTVVLEKAIPPIRDSMFTSIGNIKELCKNL